MRFRVLVDFKTSYDHEVDYIILIANRGGTEGGAGGAIAPPLFRMQGIAPPLIMLNQSPRSGRFLILEYIKALQCFIIA